MFKVRTRGLPLKEKDLKSSMLIWLDYFEPYVSKENRQLFTVEMGSRYGAKAFILREPEKDLRLSGYTEYEYTVCGEPEKVCISFDPMQ